MAAEELPARPVKPADVAGRTDRGNAAEPAGSRLGRASRLALPGSTSRPASRLLVGVIVVAYAWFATNSAPFSTRALAGVLIPGAVLGTIAYGRPPERIPAPESLDLTGFSYWIIGIALLFEWEASAFRANSLSWHPSLTDLINPLLAPHPVKSAAFVVWLLAGWGLVKR
jgi:hypothetical protein